MRFAQKSAFLRPFSTSLLNVVQLPCHHVLAVNHFLQKDLFLRHQFGRHWLLTKENVNASNSNTAPLPSIQPVIVPHKSTWYPNLNGLARQLMNIAAETQSGYLFMRQQFLNLLAEVRQMEVEENSSETENSQSEQPLVVLNPALKRKAVGVTAISGVKKQKKTFKCSSCQQTGHTSKNVHCPNFREPAQ